MGKIHSYKEYQALQSINEAIDDLLQSADLDQATQIQNLVNSQEEIFKKYDLSPDEINNIKNSVEDTIRVKLGVDFKSK